MPFSRIICTRLHGQTEVKLKGMSDGAYTRWKDVFWLEKGYEDICKEGDDENEMLQIEALTMCKEKLVYLTADASETLSELKVDDIYILGGICDHNRYKVARQLALWASLIVLSELVSKQGGRAGHSDRCTADLRVHSWDADPSCADCQSGRRSRQNRSAILTSIPQVFDIMCSWLVTKDWSKAFEAVIPKRKLKGKSNAAET